MNFIAFVSIEHFDISGNKAVLVQYFSNSVLHKKIRGYMQIYYQSTCYNSEVYSKRGIE